MRDVSAKEPYAFHGHAECLHQHRLVTPPTPTPPCSCMSLAESSRIRNQRRTWKWKRCVCVCACVLFEEEITYGCAHTHTYINTCVRARSVVRAHVCAYVHSYGCKHTYVHASERAYYMLTYIRATDLVTSTQSLTNSLYFAHTYAHTYAHTLFSRAHAYECTRALFLSHTHSLSHSLSLLLRPLALSHTRNTPTRTFLLPLSPSCVRARARFFLSQRGAGSFKHAAAEKDRKLAEKIAKKSIYSASIFDTRVPPSTLLHIHATPATILSFALFFTPGLVHFISPSCTLSAPPLALSFPVRVHARAPTRTASLCISVSMSLSFSRSLARTRACTRAHACPLHFHAHTRSPSKNGRGSR